MQIYAVLKTEGNRNLSFLFTSRFCDFGPLKRIHSLLKIILCIKYGVVYLLVFFISISRTVSLDLQHAILWCPCNRTSSNVNKRTEYILINRKL